MNEAATDAALADTDRADTDRANTDRANTDRANTDRANTDIADAVAADSDVATDDEPDLVIETVADLFSALRSDDFLIRIAILRQVSVEPEAALSFGKYDGMDIVDEMVHQGYQPCGKTYLKSLMIALSSFGGDPRALEFIKKMFAGSRQPDIVDLAARLLARSPNLGDTLPAMRAMLHQDTSEKHARAAAQVLASRPELASVSSAERIRLVLLTPRQSALTPPFGPGDLIHRADWLRELSGPYTTEARLRLQEIGEPAATLLAECWPLLSPELQQWFLGWGSGAAPLRVLPLLESALLDDTGKVGLSVQLAAIQAVPTLQGAASLLHPRLSRFLNADIDPALRLAALRAGAPVTPERLREMIRHDSSRPVQLLAIELLGAQANADALPDLLELLQSSVWDLRSAAADALAQLPADIVIEPVRALMVHDDPGVRAAAANVLVAHGDDLWLEETFL